MKLTRSGAVFALLFVLTVLPVFAQTSSRQETTVDIQQLRQLREATESDATLEDDLRQAILALYDAAISSLDKAAGYRAAGADFERQRTGIDRTMQRLRRELERPVRRPQLSLPDKPTVAQAEDALTRERARLAAKRAALRDQQRLAEDRVKTRSEISLRLGELDLELESLNDELRQLTESAMRTELKAATRLGLLARKQAANAEIEMLRARLALFNDRSSLIPAETDLAQRRLSYSQAVVSLLEEEAHELLVKQAREALEAIRELSHELSERLPSVAPIAAETEDLALALWGPEGVITRSEDRVAALDGIRHHQAQLNRIADLTGRKFEAYGHRGSVTRWWPDVPEDFPEPGTIAGVIAELDEEIPEIEHRLITYEQQRARAHELARTTMLELDSEFADGLDPELAQMARELLDARQDLLDELIQRLGQYSSLLVEYHAASGKFLDRTREVERFLYSHILWSRSVPRPIIPRLRDIGQAMGWLVSTEHLRSISIVGFEFTGTGIVAGLLLAVIVLLRQPMRRRLRELATRVADPEADSLRHTIGALLLTLLLAAPLPLALYIAGRLIEGIGGSSYWFASAEAFDYLAMVTLLIESVRQLFAPHGLAEAHFGWPTHATRPLYRGLIPTEAIGLPLLYIALHLAFAGMRLDSPDQLQIHNNSLGRVAFIAALLLFGMALLAMLRPEKKTEPSDQEMRVPWPRRFTDYAFPTAFLGAYPIVVFATIVPAILAAVGFYVTGMLLAYQMLRTLLLALVVMVGGGLVHRWRIVNRYRAMHDAPEDFEDEDRIREFEAAEKQVRQLLRFGAVAVLAIGLLSIWSDALPMLQLLKRVQILPRVQMLEAVDDRATALRASGTPTEAPSAAASQPEAAPAPDGSPSQAEVAPGHAGGTDAKPLTLWTLLEAVLAGLIAVVLVRNLPGVIEIVLQRRSKLDSGARVAFSTLARYSITIIGTIVVFGLLGISWSRIQWLAAALTFGLGFGLQEIVANFVSGLILLVERPVRVGDVVTIGNLMGRVTRIQIRATTITLWDRSEMIVPNKEFITTKLVNWTLSDSKRRIEIPLRIAYGTDLDQVKAILVDIAQQHPSVLEDPPPHVLLLAFGNDAINIELRFVVDFGQGLTTKDQVQMSIEGAFRKHRIEFALPRSEVRFISEGGKAPDALDPATS